MSKVIFSITDSQLIGLFISLLGAIVCMGIYLIAIIVILLIAAVLGFPSLMFSKDCWLSTTIFLTTIYILFTIRLYKDI